MDRFLKLAAMDYRVGLTALGVIVCYLFVRSIYRLYFHPLSKFPGPRLAAVTHLYEFYYDAIKGGRLLWEIERMHNVYGPIVRINPRELHIRDPYYYDTIYLTKKQEKDPYLVNFSTSPRSGFATVDHEHHRRRRALVNPFFSKKAVMGLEHVVQDQIDKVSRRLERHKESGAVFCLDDLFAALTADVISDYTFGESMGILDKDDLQNDLHETVTGLAATAPFNRFFPIFGQIADIWPELIVWLQPTTKGLLNTKRMVEKKSIAALKAVRAGEPVVKSKKTVFDSICNPSLPPEEITPARIRDEAMIMLGGGTETTARVLSFGCYHLYSNKGLLEKLREELKSVMPEPTSTPAWPQLEQLPYLTALINESFRLSHSVTIRLPRVSPAEPLVYKDYTIPPGTSVSQGIYFMHTDPEVFPDPHTFNVERWIKAAERGERLTRFLVPFTKGPRICLGMNLAYCELYLMFAALIRRYDLEIRDTTPESIRITRDLMIGLPESMVYQVKAAVTGIIEH